MARFKKENTEKKVETNDAVNTQDINMDDNPKAKAFQQFLTDIDIKAFTPQKVDDEMKTVLFRSNFQAENVTMPMAVLIDNSVFVIIRTQLTNADEVDDKVKLMERMNALNQKYKIFKYYLREDGNVYMDTCLPFKENVDGELIQLMLNLTLQHLESDAIRSAVLGKEKETKE